MQHLTVADKSLLIGNVLGDLLLEYSALLGRIGSADTVKIQAIGADGDEVVAGLLLNEGTVLVVESSTSALPEPENGDVEAYMRERIERFDFASSDPFPMPDEDARSGPSSQ
jgi:hypothetical protein